MWVVIGAQWLSYMAVLPGFAACDIPMLAACANPMLAACDISMHVLCVSLLTMCAPHVCFYAFCAHITCCMLAINTDNAKVVVCKCEQHKSAKHLRHASKFGDHTVDQSTS